MKTLLIEDDPDWVETMRVGLDDAAPHSDLAVGADRDAAFGLLAAGTYDLIICDLRIPPDDTGLEPDEVHGLAVLDRAEEVAPGTRIIVLSGFGNLENVGPFLKRQGPADYFGTGRSWNMRDDFKKNEVDVLFDELAEFASESRELDDIELTGAVVSDLEPEEVRVIRGFARRYDGQTVAVESLNEGRSSARTLRVEVRNRRGALSHLSVAKLDSIDAVRDECMRYERRIQPLLPVGAYTDLAREVTVGAGARAGCFYKLLEGYDDSLFSVLRADPDRAAAVVESLKGNLSRWSENAVAVTWTLETIRREHAPDDVLTHRALAGLPLSREETRSVAINLGTGHCDAHGGNVLVDGSGHPMPIDYARASETSVVFDPVTLELAAVCHPDALAGPGWPTDDQWSSWFDLETFVASSPIEAYVRACRRWANDVKRGDRELLSCAYTYMLRQSQYGHVPDTVLTAAVGGVVGELASR